MAFQAGRRRPIVWYRSAYVEDKWTFLKQKQNENNINGYVTGDPRSGHGNQNCVSLLRQTNPLVHQTSVCVRHDFRSWPTFALNTVIAGQCVVFYVRLHLSRSNNKSSSWYLAASVVWTGLKHFLSRRTSPSRRRASQSRKRDGQECMLLPLAVLKNTTDHAISVDHLNGNIFPRSTLFLLNNSSINTKQRSNDK